MGTPLPEDPATATVALRNAIRTRREQRQHAQAVAARRPTIEAAIAQATVDRQLRASPELERLRSWGEDLELRIQRARHQADQTMLHLARFIEWARSGDHAADEDAKAPGEHRPTDASQLPGVTAMAEMVRQYKEVRGITDSIGADESTES